MNSLEQTIDALQEARQCLSKALETIGDLADLRDRITVAQDELIAMADAPPIGKRRISPYRLVPGNATGMYSVMQAGHEFVTIDGANCWPQAVAQQIADRLNQEQTIPAMLADNWTTVGDGGWRGPTT